jgi:hypothetical protein
MFGQQAFVSGGRPLTVSGQGQVYSTARAPRSAGDSPARQLQGQCLSSSNAVAFKSDIGAQLNAQAMSNLYCRAESGVVEGVNVLVACAFCR